MAGPLVEKVEGAERVEGANKVAVVVERAQGDGQAPQGILLVAGATTPGQKGND